MDIVYRFENANDFEQIEGVTANAFLDHPHSNGSEPKIIKSLRKEGALVISLVAELDNKIIGHIAFSAIEISDGTKNWYALGPVSVIPKHQCHSIGTTLVEKGIKELIRLEAGGCVLIGEPEYYRRFGFQTDPHLLLDKMPPEYFQILLLKGERPKGNVTYNSSFFG